MFCPWEDWIDFLVERETAAMSGHDFSNSIHYPGRFSPSPNLSFGKFLGMSIS
jgi:hypothetical protein